MFLVDDLLMAPVKGLVWMFKEIHDAAQQELAGEAAAITAALRELYLSLESGQITEAQFDAQEKALLDRLDHLQTQETGAAPRNRPGKPRPKARRARKRLGSRGRAARGEARPRASFLPCPL